MPSKAFLKLKKEIKDLIGYNKGYYAGFWLGYIHGICDYHKYGELTKKEAVNLEAMFNIRKRNRCQTKSK